MRIQYIFDKIVNLQWVMDNLPKISNKRDFDSIKRSAKKLINDGWGLYDIKKYLQCLEEVNPDISEKLALSRMAEIRRKYD